MSAPASHEGAWELLPWYANGTLGGAEREAVEAHLAGCPECREELARCRTLAAEVRASAVAPSPHPAQLAGLLRRIDAAEAAGAGSTGGAGARQPRRRGAAGVLARTPRAVRWLLLAQAAALLALLLAVAALARRPAAEFRTLSDPAAAAAPVGQVRVVFAPEATEAELRALLLTVRGELAGGPSPLGAYVVSLPAGPDAEPLPVVLAHLRAHPRVRFAEPVAGAARQGPASP